jgi:broad specificity phosphatase PhoE
MFWYPTTTGYRYPGCIVSPTSTIHPKNRFVVRSQQQRSDRNDGSVVEEVASWTFDPTTDVFASCGDRLDRDPLPLPELTVSNSDRTIRVTLLRHGQSTWNRKNRVQGSSDFSVLTEKGMDQARAAASVLSSLGWVDTGGVNTSVVFQSPLARARQTAEIVLGTWGEQQERSPDVTVHPSLREIDLYSFQGMDKYSNRAKESPEYGQWKASPATFEIDGHVPVKELWYRASLVWQDVCKPEHSDVLVVAHNATNQAMICTALGLPPTMFRRITQSNASLSRLDITYAEGGGTHVQVHAINFFPMESMLKKEIGNTNVQKLILLCRGSHMDHDQSAGETSVLLPMIRDIDQMIPCMVAVGSPGEQSSDVLTAAKEVSMVAIVDQEACSMIVKNLLGIDNDAVSFHGDPGSMTMLTFSNNKKVAHLVCSNYTTLSPQT